MTGLGERPALRRTGSTIVTLALLFVVFDTSAGAQVTSDSAFTRILSEYRKLGAKPRVGDLVKLHTQVEDAVAAFEVGVQASMVRTPNNLLRLAADFSEIGVMPDAQSGAYYTLKLLRQAHATDPNSEFRNQTLLVTLSPERPDPVDPMSLFAAKDYLDEFPQFAGSGRVAIDIAHFYDDFTKILRDSLKGPGNVAEYRLPCFKPYITNEPLPDQLAAARDSAVRYYNKSLSLNPRLASLREQQILVKSGLNASWYRC